MGTKRRRQVASLDPGLPLEAGPSVPLRVGDGIAEAGGSALSLTGLATLGSDVAQARQARLVVERVHEDRVGSKIRWLSVEIRFEDGDGSQDEPLVVCSFPFGGEDPWRGRARCEIGDGTAVVVDACLDPEDCSDLG